MAGGGYFRADKCHVCRKRKVKCGSERPSCHRCLRAGLICPGYQRALDFYNISSEKPQLLSERSDVSLGAESSQNRFELFEPRSTPRRKFAILESSYIIISPASQHQEAYLSTLLNLYLPASFSLIISRDDNTALIPAVCSTWLYSACQFASRSGSNSLRYSLLAMAVAMASSDRPPEEISRKQSIHNSTKLYLKSLLSMRSAINVTGTQNLYAWETLGLSCFACFSYEVSGTNILGAFSTNTITDDYRF